MQSKHWPPSDPPPSYDGSRKAGAFDEYKIKAKLWLKTSNLNDSMKGTRLLQGLTGRAFEQMEAMALDEAETWLDAENGGQQLIALMSSEWLFGKLSNKDLAQELQEICYDCMKYENGDSADFHAKVDEQARKLKRAKVEFPSQVSGFLLMKNWSDDHDGTSGDGAATSTWLAGSPEDLEAPSAEGAEGRYDEEREILETALHDSNEEATARSDDEILTEEDAKGISMSPIKSQHTENDPVRTRSHQYRCHWHCGQKFYDEEGYLSTCLRRCILAKDHAGHC